MQELTNRLRAAGHEVWHSEDYSAVLVCGDAREVLPSIEAADMVFTDPPFCGQMRSG